MKVLVIDDEQTVLMPINKRLEELGYQVCTTPDAIDGILLFDSFKPNLVIVDINMPEISGIEFINHIRIKKNESLPIIVLSGNTEDDVIKEAFKLGINDYIKKPICLDDICSRIKRLNIFFQTH
ncbi:MAG: response regulator [Algibacter sp.]|uniref:response regulator n=1 Tax=Algibacter sp. TaxID=1872428 RepID=UPI00329A280B